MRAASDPRRGGKAVVIDPRRTRTARRGGRAPLHPPRHRRATLRAGARSSTSWPTRALAAHVAGLTPSRSRRASPGRGGDVRDRRAGDPGGAELAGAAGRGPGRWAPTQRFDDCQLAGRRAQRRHRQPRPPHGAMLQHRCGSSNTAGEPGRGRGAARRWPAARAGRALRDAAAARLAGRSRRWRAGRALLTIAGNPAVSTAQQRPPGPGGRAADFMVSIDIYINGPPTPSSSRPLAAAFRTMTWRSWAGGATSPTTAAGAHHDGHAGQWRRCCVHRRRHQAGSDADVAGDRPLRRLETRAGGRRCGFALPRPRPRSCWLRSRCAWAWRILDLLLRSGPYRLTPQLEAAPHGIDLGPLEPRVPELLRTASGKIELAPEALVADVARLHEALAEPVNGAMVLVGRRDLRSNNSWMHNLPMLVSGKQRCTVHVHPHDAESARAGRRRGGSRALARRRRGRPRRGDAGRHAGRRLDPTRMGP